MLANGSTDLRCDAPFGRPCKLGQLVRRVPFEMRVNLNTTLCSVVLHTTEHITIEVVQEGPYSVRVASRLGSDRLGRPVVIVTAPSTDGLKVGDVFVVLGNNFPAGDVGITWLGKNGRPPTLAEQTTARAPYRSMPPRLVAETDDDDQLAEQAAIELARLEQQRTPADLLNAAA